MQTPSRSRILKSRAWTGWTPGSPGRAGRTPTRLAVAVLATAVCLLTSAVQPMAVAAAPHSVHVSRGRASDPWRRPAHFFQRHRNPRASRWRARHHTSLGSVLILSTSVNGGSSSAEAVEASNLGYTVSVVSATTWTSMSVSGFQSYNAIILGDPSSGGSCASSASTSLWAAEQNSGLWGSAVDGNVALLGTAPVYANTAGSQALMNDAISYALASGSGKTGLYLSLNCYYSTASAGTPVVPLQDLFGVSGDNVTVRGTGSCSDAH